MKAYDFIDSNIGKKVYLTCGGDLGMDSRLRKYIIGRTKVSEIPDLTIVERTRAGLAYLKTDNGFVSVPIGNVRLYSELKDLNEENKKPLELDEALLKPVIKAIDDFYGYEMGDPNLTLRESITEIQAEYHSKDEFLVISITTRRPGIIIGKGGESIDKLKAYLVKNLKVSDIRIQIIENKLRWYSEMSYGFDWDNPMG